ncbi:hypothetical protein T635_2722 [Acinetobacter baumannii MRSN 7341]|nr:hypothetical protein T635_2722 [Acinetobacter baumannii MRSN 7341]
MSEKQINMSDAQYILSTKLILVPFLQIKVSSHGNLWFYF